MGGTKGTHKLSALQAQRIAAGLGVGDLAKKANVSDWLIRQIECGANCEHYESERIANALGVSLATLGKTDF